MNLKREIKGMQFLYNDDNERERVGNLPFIVACCFTRRYSRSLPKTFQTRGSCMIYFDKTRAERQDSRND